MLNLLEDDLPNVLTTMRLSSAVAGTKQKVTSFI